MFCELDVSESSATSLINHLTTIAFPAYGVMIIIALQICPYYLSRDQIESAELILMPYNYLIDSDSRDSVKIHWENAVVIVDEAHNIEGAAAEAASFDLTAAITSGCISDLKVLLADMRGG